MHNSLLRLVVITLSVFTFGSVSAADIPRSKPLSGMKQMPAKGASVAAEIIECPAKLMNVNVSITSTFSAPSGWAPKGAPTGYSGLTLSRSYHSVLGNKLWCTYGRSSLPTSLRTTSVSRTAPTGKTCSTMSGFKFSCK